jgi:hypothetical protein
VAADQTIIAREIIPSQYMEGDRAEESRGQKGKSYRHSGTFSKGLRRIPFPRSLAFCSGPERPGAAATDPKTPDAVARRTVSPPSADRSTASPRTTSAASPFPWGRWDLGGGGRGGGGAGGRAGDRAALPASTVSALPALDEGGRRRISKQVSTRNSRAAPAKQHEQWAHRWSYSYTTGMWGPPHATRPVSERVRQCQSPVGRYV